MATLSTNLRAELIQKLANAGIVEFHLYDDCLEVVVGPDDEVIMGIEGTFTKPQVSRSFGIPESMIDASALTVEAIRPSLGVAG